MTCVYIIYTNDTVITPYECPFSGTMIRNHRYGKEILLCLLHNPACHRSSGPCVWGDVVFGKNVFQ